MSVTANRLSLAEARAAAECVAGLWGLNTPDVLLVGSVRRQRDSVGDLEFTCRRPAEGEPDPLFARMAPTVRVGGLFAAEDDRPEVVATGLKGFVTHFAYTDLLVDLTRTDGVPFAVRVQIHRWEPDGVNRGWIELMRTGPLEFGKWFLNTWRRRWQLKGEASVDGMLVYGSGHPAATPTEADCFRLAGINFIEPDRRDAFAAQRGGTTHRDQAFLRR